MTELIIKLSEATDPKEVDRIVQDNIQSIPNPFNRNFFCHMANLAKIRIHRIRREARMSYKTHELN